MDLEQLRKINQLSSELKRHGMAENSTEAYSQAQQIVQIIPKQPASPEGSTVIEAAPAEPLAMRQFQIELEKIQKTANEELDVLRNAMNQIIAEVNSLREDISKIQTAPVAQKPKEKQAELQTPKESHPRQGDYKPGDIDIKSVFYFGTKK